MAVAFSIDRAFVEKVIHAIERGEPIPHDDPRGWSSLELQVVGGACLFACLSHGMTDRPPDEIPDDEIDEAWAQAMNEIMSIFGMVSDIVLHVKDGIYDQKYKSNVVMGAMELGEDGDVHCAMM